VWIADCHPANRLIRVPGQVQSNQLGEVVAVVAALQAIENYIPITLKTDSMYTINGLTRDLMNWEDKGWIGVANADAFWAAAALLRIRTAPTAFKWVKEHSGEEGNEKADRLVEIGVKKDVPDSIDLSIPPCFDIQGAKMFALMQRIAYQGIMSHRQRTPWRNTTHNLDTMCHALEEIAGHMENNETLWRNCQRKDLRRKVQQFIIKAIHGTFKIRAYWWMIPGYEERSACQLCWEETTETMEHILLWCHGSHQKMLWQLMQKAWSRKYGPCSMITLGTILGCRSIGVPQSRGRPTKEEAAKIAEDKAGKRLLRVLVSETAYLIWLLQCEAVVGE
jgi:ribonuclease HI